MLQLIRRYFKIYFNSLVISTPKFDGMWEGNTLYHLSSYSHLVLNSVHFLRIYTPSVTLVTAKNQHRCWKARIYACAWISNPLPSLCFIPVLGEVQSHIHYHKILEDVNSKMNTSQKLFVTFQRFIHSLGLYLPIYIWRATRKSRWMCEKCRHREWRIRKQKWTGGGLNPNRLLDSELISLACWADGWLWVRRRSGLRRERTRNKMPTRKWNQVESYRTYNELHYNGLMTDLGW